MEDNFSRIMVVEDNLERILLETLAQPRKTSMTLGQLQYCGMISSDDHRSLVWTGWFLRPSFTRVKDVAEWKITFLRNSKLFNVLFSTPIESKQKMRACIQHIPETGYSWECSIGCFRVLYEADNGVICAALPEEKEVLIIAAEENVRAHTTMMRVVREFASLDHQRNGALIVHAAAMEKDGQATIVLAPKKGGKTTYLIRTLKSGANLIANDRVVLYQRPEGLFVTGMPTIVSLRMSTLDLFPGMREEIDDRGLHFWRRAYHPQWPDKRNISPLQLANLTGSTLIKEARLSRVICLKSGSGDPVLLDDRKMTQTFHESLFDYTDSNQHFFASLHPVSGEIFRKTAEQLCRMTLQQAECLECPREGDGKEKLVTEPKRIHQNSPMLFDSL